MFKYVLKRLGLSLIVLLGVSVIIYFLVRLMPTNYLETKFSAQIQQGTITHEQLDEFKKRYGLYMPDAYLDITIDHESISDVTFSRDTRSQTHADLENEIIKHNKFYAGTYEGSRDDLYLELKEDGTFRVYEKTDDSTVTVISGLFSASASSFTMQVTQNNSTCSVNAEYSVAKFGEKLSAVLSGYFIWLGNMLRGDLGDSFLYQQPVGKVIADHMWISFLISLVALVLQFVISIPLGIMSATRQYSVADYSVTIITMIGISLPSFFFAALLIKIFSSWLGWFPAFGLVTGGASSTGIAYTFDMLHHLVLPMIVLVVLSIGGLMRYTRTNMLEVLNSDYIRTARSKGLSEKKVIYVHAFRNTMIPLMTLLAGILPSLFGGAMITEEVFAIDGIGRLAYKALQQGDVPFIMGYNMFLAVLTVIGTLLSDLMYAVVDPRVKLSK